MKQKKFTLEEIAPFMAELADALAGLSVTVLPTVPTEEETIAIVRVAMAMSELTIFLWDTGKVNHPEIQLAKRHLENFIKRNSD